MNQRLLIVLFTALGFGAGFGAHVWIADEAVVPPPPAGIGSEFAHGPGTPAVASATDPKNENAKHPSTTEPPLNRTKLIGDLEHYSSQIKTYQANLDQLDAEFEHGLLPLLSEEQRGRYADYQKRLAAQRAKRKAAIAAETAPLSDEEIYHLQQRPLYGVLSSVSITVRFDGLNKELKLTPEQEPKVRDLLIARRTKFLELVDASPPPTITLSQLAMHVEKIGTEPPKTLPD